MYNALIQIFVIVSIISFLIVLYVMSGLILAMGKEAPTPNDEHLFVGSGCDCEDDIKGVK